MRLQSFYDVSQSMDSASFEARLVNMANELDFPLVSAALVLADPATRQAPQVFAVGNTPQAYLEASQNRDSVARDPVIKQMKTLSLPFFDDDHRRFELQTRALASASVLYHWDDAADRLSAAWNQAMKVMTVD